MSIITPPLTENFVPAVLTPAAAKPALRLKVIESLETMIASEKRWNELASEHPFLRWDWIVSWWQTFGERHAAKVLVAIDPNGRWVGLFPLYIHHQKLWGRVLANMANDRACSDHVRPIVAPEFASAAMDLMADWIVAGAKAGDFDVIDWDGVDQGDPLMNDLIDRLARKELAVRSAEIEGCWISPLPADWNTFERATKKCFRRKLQKARRNISEHDVSLTVCATPAEIRRHWSAFIQVHEARQQQKNSSGCFSESGFADFLQAYATRSASRGETVLIVAEHQGELVGAILMLVTTTHIFFYQSGFNPAKRWLEPGHLLNVCGIQWAIANGKSHFDFLRGDEPYKSRWNATRQPMHRVRLFAPRWWPRMKRHIWDWRQTLRGWKTKDAETLDSAESDAAESVSCAGASTICQS